MNDTDTEALVKFFENQFWSRFTEQFPCEELEDGCPEGKEEGTLVDGYSFANRLIIRILDWKTVAVFVQDENREYVNFELDKDIFIDEMEDLIPEILDVALYPDDVVIFSGDKEIFSSSYSDIGEIIHLILKEQSNLLMNQIEQKRVVE